MHYNYGLRRSQEIGETIEPVTIDLYCYIKMKFVVAPYQYDIILEKSLETKH